jgi:FtsP/CotA-like multicopper oxidase with cupredoxin domain
MRKPNDMAGQTPEIVARPAVRRLCRGGSGIRAGIVVSVLLVPSWLAAAPQDGPACPANAPPLSKVGEIKSRDGSLQAVIKVVSGNRNVPTSTKPMMLRYFEGYNPTDSSQKWPTDPSAAGPGPTLRAEIGDTVQITFLNQVKVEDFGGTLDRGDEGKTNGCDQSNGINPDGTRDKNWYPADDKYPNCFHGSSSANLHFHGTHVTPSTTGDNVLINVRPNQKVTERDVKEPFNQIFHHCQLGHEPKKWGDLPWEWRDFQEILLREYDATATYVGPGRSPSGHGLPRDLQLWPQNQQAIAQGLWPQWYSGAYPYCFQIPKYTEHADGHSNVQMGQAPGTHWYHSHKHGSTALNLFNGLAGAFIITDTSPTGYDGKLHKFYEDKGGLQEKVLVFQQIASALNMLSTPKQPGVGPRVLVNGQLTPVIEMLPGQVQLWRMINASVQKSIIVQLAPPFESRQTAQDGVQLAWENYNKPENNNPKASMAPANRVDLLVQAPTVPGCYEVKNSDDDEILLYVIVKGSGQSMGFPAQESDFPTLPDFLKNIDESTIHIQRKISYSAKKSEQLPDDRRRIQFTIDGKQFGDQAIDQVMLLGSAEEWTLYNYDTSDTGTGIAHPFHIHVNPFQVVEVFDPNDTTKPQPQKLSPPFVWWDTFAIPAGKLVDGKVVPGYFKMRSRFVDFTGQYVQHCHILAHEDRGMMQLLEVVDNKTPLKHH